MQSISRSNETRPLPANIPELTSVRFFAAMFVVLFHAYDHNPWLQSLPTLFFEKGPLGVDMFFILSGFILTHVYLAAWRAGSFSYRSFMINRFARVYPLHLVMTLAFVMLYVAASSVGVLDAAEGMDWSALPFHLAAVHAWGFVGHHAWNFPSWSISSEFFAYLIFPLFLAFTRLGARAGLAVSAVALCVAYFTAGAVFRPFTALTFDFGIVRIFFEFGLGVFLYLMCSRVEIAPRTARWLATGAAVLFVVLAHFGAIDLVLILLSGAIIFLLGQASRSDAPSLMKSRVLVYLGEISYSTYMIHYLVLLAYTGLVGRIVGTPDALPLLPWLGLFPLIFVGSMLSFHVVEVPARDWIRRMIHERRPREWQPTP